MKTGKEQLGLSQPSPELPESIRNELEIADRIPDKEFWTEKNLEYWFGKDDMFGVKLHVGFSEMLGNKLKKRFAEYEDETFDRLIGAVQNPALRVSEKAHAAIQLRDFVSKTYGIPFGQLTARNVLAHAYICEAEAMRSMGLNPERNLPFSRGLRPDDAEHIKSFLPEKQEYDGTETTIAAFQPEIEKLADEFYELPGLFENYIQWLDDVAQTVGKKNLPAEILEQLRSIGQMERDKSSDRRDIIAKQIICLRQIKKNLRANGVADDALTDEAFQKWLQSKRPHQRDAA